LLSVRISNTRGGITGKGTTAGKTIKARLSSFPYCYYHLS